MLILSKVTALLVRRILRYYFSADLVTSCVLEITIFEVCIFRWQYLLIEGRFLSFVFFNRKIQMWTTFFMRNFFCGTTIDAVREAKPTTCHKWCFCHFEEKIVFGKSKPCGIFFICSICCYGVCLS